MTKIQLQVYEAALAILSIITIIVFTLAAVTLIG